ncbi:hypothetical protein A3A93_00730 [Candidatus Roizmanbacteria bacterium RIFCSPLOWO2_01_FULL_38_12]|uniref:DUF2029 domain-containing protein n=1 Tax=Candidatus Roizmanbacteria bacterium RIFCSPLOWO2_01_FULL_38_12 TaxID=1802061 RepID=A0A1F7J088_9BACT|nr:MAG: hypothetical protein A2861_00160 [Candidatus Roizmanbacteria bacterium RIFCSPHIGHO2_01_FULL_38_15]OGK36109.1 MAG: hypothetical protein A3F59_01405 [Candidatus Roizmanbacteria bacterium RIFCSPHIGHO2_12_FULL_38_13]OGK49020.1 MAG: hypothetical protein A3A93_00730 [Candidatus Roizmanbacteria bacterium RIFCSPLOWO2_01_FULL_38_12]
MIIIIVYLIVLIGLSTYSYVLIDPNLTLINASWWRIFQDTFIQIGYYQRELSWYLYLALVLLLFLFHFIFISRSMKIASPFTLAILVSLIIVISYPFLSHDFFNYIFDAKIFTYYHQNPYLKTPLDFPRDEWLRFMHWVHRSYPYGPSFLVLTIIPSFLAFGKFILNFVFFKFLFIASYLIGVYYLQKIDKRSALVFATHPLIIIEGLVNAHNDLIAVSLAVAGFYYLKEKKEWMGRLLLLLSGGIKYITLPLLFLRKKKEHWLNRVAVFGVVLLIAYLSLFREIQPWYFLTLFIFLPIYPKFIDKLQIFIFGLLMSYYPFIRLGDWTNERLLTKHWIIISSIILNLLYLLIYKRVYSLLKK